MRETFTAEQQAASRVYLDTDDQARAALGVDPTLVLSGPPPQLVDEWPARTCTLTYVARGRGSHAADGLSPIG